MKRFAVLAASLLILLNLAACGGTPDYDADMQDGADVQNGEEAVPVHIPPPDEPVYMEITVTAGENILDGVLFDNDTARALAAMLPLTVDLWHPAPGFAKAFNLPEQIPDVEQRTRQYEKGGLAYWYEGPSVAIFYGDHLEQTIVPVVTVGRLTSDVDFLEEYTESITIEQKNEPAQ